RTDAYDGTTRKPDVSFGDTLDGDLSRRDFTVNSMAVPLPLDPSRPIVDPFGGIDDLAARLLRTPVRPEQSFDDDPLRMLRAAPTSCFGGRRFCTTSESRTRRRSPSPAKCRAATARWSAPISPGPA